MGAGIYTILKRLLFSPDHALDVLHISRQTCYLMGRDRAVADIPIDHPSISKQHAVIQFRLIRERNEFGDEKQSVK
jgi:smad nuclear-interacting protein 1